MSNLWVLAAARESTETCNCEHAHHFPDLEPKSEWHPYGADTEGPMAHAEMVGSICPACAKHHLADYLTKPV